MQTLEDLEREIHGLLTRSCRARLRALLHPEFREIGYSGREYTGDAILENLSDDRPPVIHATGFRHTWLGPDRVLLTYESAQVEPDGRRHRPARRSSIWCRHGGRWRLLFHQGTPVRTTTFDTG